MRKERHLLSFYITGEGDIRRYRRKQGDIDLKFAEKRQTDLRDTNDEG